MPATDPTGLTAEEFWEWAADQDWGSCRYELHAGNVVRFPLCGLRHGLVCGTLCYLLTEHGVRRRGGMAMSNNTALLTRRGPDTLLGPDLMFFARSKPLAELSDRFSVDVPTLTIEVIEPDDHSEQTLWRVGEYLRRGVPLVWIVDPEDRTIGVHRKGEIPQTFDETDELTGEDVLPDLKIAVAELFKLPGEQPRS